MRTPCGTIAALFDSGHIAAVGRSRDALLSEIGDAPDLTLVRGFGNVGDELIWAGTRALLDGHVYREIGIDDLPANRGGTALLCGGGAFSRSYNEYMPEALAVAELRFDRVIVLPSSFDVSVDRVREALRRTRATVFAREDESLRRISGLCRARRGHDCAFFFDFSDYAAAGEGTLNAFRTDRESTGELPLPDDNDDISATCETLEQWLAIIDRHAVVRTDRAHVMIAAALMGKEAHYAPGNYFKVEALAQDLRQFPVQRIETATPAPPRDASDTPLARATRGRLRCAAAASRPALAAAQRPGEPRVTAVVLVTDRAQHAARAVRSILDSSVPARVALIAQASGTPARRSLTALAAAEPAVELRITDRNLGCAGGRLLAVEQVPTEYVLFLDDDAELIDGALEHLVADLDRHPEAAGTTALVAHRDGTVYHFGGRVEVSDELVEFEIHGSGRAFDDPALAPTGPTGWAPGTAALYRTQAFRDVPLDAGMADYFEDNDWCYRVELARPGSFRRCREALAMHELPRSPSASPFIERAHVVRRLVAIARFQRTHGRLLTTGFFDLVPELRRRDGPDLVAARLLLELVTARGPEWVLAQWCSGELAPLLDGAHAEAGRLGDAFVALRARNDDMTAHAANLEGHAARLEARVASLDDYVPQLDARAITAELELERLRPEVARLTEREATLQRIENGGWWRLRTRLLPLLRAGAWVRRRVSRSER